jgi:tetratricopeptide (TPR) repeat protein
MPGIDGATLRAWRRSRGWDVPELAQRLRRAASEAGVPVATHDGLVRMIYAWERGDHKLTERYELLYTKALNISPDRLGRLEDGSSQEISARASGTLTRSRLDTLTAGQLDELICLLNDQWHALVRTDNLLGPRHALGGVRAQLDVIDALLRAVRLPARRDVLQLGARYAESAAWLHEDSGDMPGARYWTGRSMEWALEAGDRLMMSWTLFRRGEHAAADGDASAAVGLAGAARREGGELPSPMLAAILQQEAHAYALDGAEAACQTALDQAHERAASPDDPGDASSGHGSFCTPGYVEMQRGRCWLRLGRPAEAMAAFDSALLSLPPVYRRDRGVALSGQAAALAAIGEPREAATAAMQALGVARDTGSDRIINMVIPVATALAPYRHIEAVARLHEVLAESPGA